MKKNGFPLQTYFLLLLLAVVFSCEGQNTAKPGNQQPANKVIKNYFITQYPQEFFFVQCGLQDAAGNMWFGTGGNGIYVYDGKSFTNFTHLDGLCHDDILCCQKDRSGNIWFGTRNGLIRYKPSGQSPQKKDFTSFLISANTINPATRNREAYHFKPADNFVWYILQDKSGKIWFSTNKGIYIHDPLTDHENGTPLFTRFLDSDSLVNTNHLQLKDVLSMLQDKKGNIWFASGYLEGEGICCYNGRSLTNFKPDGISQFRSIIECRKGKLLFLNAFRGAYAYDPSQSPVPAEKDFSNFTRSIGINNDTLVCMKEDQKGNVWFGIQSDDMINGTKGGVWRYDPSASPETGKNSLRLFTKKDGLSHNCVFTIVEDKSGNLWFGTRNTGLCRYDGRTFTDFTE